VAADASLYAEEYEIVCYDSANFYSGYAKSGSLTVSLPEGTYDMLLLAGNGKQVLLGAGWLAGQVIGPETGSVTIHVKPLTILDTEMDFDDGMGNTGPPGGTPPTFGPVDPSSSGLTTKFTLHNMDALENAGTKGGVSNIYANAGGFADKRVVLKYYDDGHITSPGIISEILASAASSPNPVLTFPSLDYTPGEDWSALVYLNLQYIPFSQTTAPASSHKWSILNGLGKNASNGAVKVTAGNGGTVTIDINNDF
jgi:hypothetical protein